MTGIRIRDAREGDRDVIRDVTLSAYHEYSAFLPAADWKEYKDGILATLADVSPAGQIVAEREGTIVGTVLLYPAGTAIDTPGGNALRLEWPMVRLLAVAPQARGQGVGTALMQECIRRAREAKAGAVTLHTTELMHVARRMYERMGFVRARELDFSPADGVIIKGYRLDLGE